HIGSFEATNPCGEQPLLGYEPCNLGSINLSKMLKREGKVWKTDYAKLEKTVRLSVRFLDNVIEMCRYPAARIDAMAKANRKIGLGVMGFADMLARLRVPYGGAEGVETGEGVMKFISAAGWDESRELAKARGAFPNIKGSVFDRPGAVPVRNATVTTVAPTGTLGIIAGCSSGIEPFFSLCYMRHAVGGAVEIEETNRLIEEAAREEGFYTPGLMDFIAKGGSIKEREDVPERVREIFATAFDISPDDHVRMQAAFQRYTDNAVSKTINLPHDSTPIDVRRAYNLAYRLGCKGITVYRTGTRAGQVLSCRNTLYC
ncbi:MAG: ribonucleotide-diphosphate reductase subunit alpha, partial [Deltaproteobacteria bacterium]|nr:ribonucleotide-diphosphate reductase subunit alpha [Deltaproteobacteria bacterium]